MANLKTITCCGFFDIMIGMTEKELFGKFNEPTPTELRLISTFGSLHALRNAELAFREMLSSKDERRIVSKRIEKKLFKRGRTWQVGLKDFIRDVVEGKADFADLIDKRGGEEYDLGDEHMVKFRSTMEVDMVADSFSAEPDDSNTDYYFYETILLLANKPEQEKIFAQYILDQYKEIERLAQEEKRQSLNQEQKRQQEEAEAQRQLQVQQETADAMERQRLIDEYVKSQERLIAEALPMEEFKTLMLEYRYYDEKFDLMSEKSVETLIPFEVDDSGKIAKLGILFTQLPEELKDLVYRDFRVTPLRWGPKGRGLNELQKKYPNRHCSLIESDGELYIVLFTEEVDNLDEMERLRDKRSDSDRAHQEYVRDNTFGNFSRLLTYCPSAKWLEKSEKDRIEWIKKKIKFRTIRRYSNVYEMMIEDGDLSETIENIAEDQSKDPNIAPFNNGSWVIGLDAIQDKADENTLRLWKSNKRFFIRIETK